LHKNLAVRRELIGKTHWVSTRYGGDGELARLLRTIGASGHWAAQFEMAGGTMVSDLITYGLLASIFILNGLRMFVEKPKKAEEVPLQPWHLLKRRQESRKVSTNS
jgi:hypothetical protein